MYKILSKTSSFLERSVTFSVDGELKTFSAPASTTTFDDLILRIEREFGDKGKDGTDKEPTVSVEAEKPKTPSKTTRKKSQGK